MSKVYEFRRGIIGDYNSLTALITRSKLIMSESTYRGGTYEYLNQIQFNLGKFKPVITWYSTEHTL